jgi:hypothetical protein
VTRTRPPEAEDWPTPKAAVFLAGG